MMCLSLSGGLVCERGGKVGVSECEGVCLPCGSWGGVCFVLRRFLLCGSAQTPFGEKGCRWDLIAILPCSF